MGGYLQQALYEISVLGWFEETVRPMVQGIVNAITRAHDNIQPGSVDLSVGELLNTNINRSPASYLLNPKEERSQYAYDVDKNMTVLGFRDKTGKGLGLISWFAVHGVSVNETNHLVNGDNKGYAAYITERTMNPSSISGKGRFVSAFAQSNEGDVTPNTLGSFCTGTTIPCDGSKNDKCPTGSSCNGRGPGWEISDYESNRIIGQQQADKAIELFKQEGHSLSGTIDFRNKFFDITTMVVNGSHLSAGTTDGPGLTSLGIYQNMTHGTPLWNIIKDILRTPTKEQEKCQAPKPILIDTGEISFPFPWQPTVLEIQLFRLGDVFITSTPSELTTMSGRRLRRAIKSRLESHGFSVQDVIYSGPANGYASYCTTYEEYQEQRYEGASTPYGEHTLEAYIEAFYELVDVMANGTSIASVALPDYTSKAFSLAPPDFTDHPLLLHKFGDVLTDVNTTSVYKSGQTVKAVFVAGNPRNNVMLDSTYLTVEQLVPYSGGKYRNGKWKVIRTDNDWDTRFRWKSVSKLLGMSKATIEWDIDDTVKAGTYRLGYFGHHRNDLSQQVTPHQGYSSIFTVQ
ncbi:Neutral/alkaline nonlysosomal ceramidase [Halteromyces radiatus]|uniref:Neutral/alkaline nonlysosomal ceramidase n=1 Tax=Halteromyces radiatus TaxID=101107 RepID=UPI00221E858C|nr:Neutral/alkaline nonlysosomal ceramidase [Halteromyces radiatus]KAI8082858.1 Neutral/alkaline nonlysosomal ceramidase [Halteromyces radiatus]